MDAYIYDTFDTSSTTCVGVFFYSFVVFFFFLHCHSKLDIKHIIHSCTAIASRQTVAFCLDASS